MIGSLFTPLIGMFGEEVTVYRATGAAHLTESRKAPRGLERDVYAPEGFGYYNKANATPIMICADISSVRENRNKRDDGEVREVQLRIKTGEPIYATDDSNGTWADMVEYQGQTFKLTDVQFDRHTGFYSGSLIKASDDFAVDSGVR